MFLNNNEYTIRKKGYSANVLNFASVTFAVVKTVGVYSNIKLSIVCNSLKLTLLTAIKVSVAINCFQNLYKGKSKMKGTTTQPKIFV